MKRRRKKYPREIARLTNHSSSKISKKLKTVIEFVFVKTVIIAKPPRDSINLTPLTTLIKEDLNNFGIVKLEK